MPFPYLLRPYTREEIVSLNAGQIGVYGIFRGYLCVYVGRGDIRERLLDHLNGDNPCITRNWPNRWTGIVTSDYVNEEIRLTLEYEPICNKRVG